MTMTADTLPDDPGTLKAMLLAERARAARLATQCFSKPLGLTTYRSRR
ncbi:hypothetical protein [Nitrobacter hamburgensis]|nr:hypothetical protein [Nitrobacter hamburgensis]